MGDGVNFYGVLYGVNLIPHMLAHGEESYIVNTASLAAVSLGWFLWRQQTRRAGAHRGRVRTRTTRCKAVGGVLRPGLLIRKFLLLNAIDQVQKRARSTPTIHNLQPLKRC